ncbi:MAG: hypothetical protein EOM20_06800 [Spartobacteria bacterium]|nr:hypothetical protein [Spartobacteria bacterium]
MKLEQQMVYLKQALGSDVVRAKVFASTTGGKFSKLAQRVCDGDQTHMGLIFEFENNSAIYIEAYFRVGVRLRPYGKLEEFLRADPDNRVWIAPTDIEDAEARALFRDCCNDIGRAGYYEWQLVLMWLHERLGRALRFSLPNTEDLVVCSEWVARRLYIYGYNLLDSFRDDFEKVTPVSGWERIVKINAQRGLPHDGLELQLTREDSDDEKVYVDIIG